MQLYTRGNPLQMYADAGILRFLLRFYVDGDRIFQCDAIWMKDEIETKRDACILTASTTSHRGKGRAQLGLNASQISGQASIPLEDTWLRPPNAPHAGTDLRLSIPTTNAMFATGGSGRRSMRLHSMDSPQRGCRVECSCFQQTCSGESNERVSKSNGVHARKIGT